MGNSVKLAVWVDGPSYYKDAIFSDPNPSDPDGRLASFCALERRLVKDGGWCHTQDVCFEKGQIPDIVLFLDIPKKPVDKLIGIWRGKVRKFVILQEADLIIPRNWDSSFHQQFEKIFTWNDDMVDNRKYFKLNYGKILPVTIFKDIKRKQKLFTLIARNAKSSHPLELYSKRVEAIRWFEANHSEDFDFYGRGWNEYLFQGPKLWRGLNRIKLLTKILAPKFSSYRGSVDKKQEILEKYKFSICYENLSGMPGYISEKILDCFTAGCLPIYWGAPNIQDYIPKNCFFDKRDFSTYEALYEHMKTMSDTEYLSRLDAIELFLNSENGRKFSVDCFVETIVSAFNVKL